jgi:hypothetical protein
MVKLSLFNTWLYDWDPVSDYNMFYLECLYLTTFVDTIIELIKECRAREIAQTRWDLKF